MNEPRYAADWEVRCAADQYGHVRVWLEQGKDPFLTLSGSLQVADVDMAARFGALRTTLALQKARRMARRRNKALDKAARYFHEHPDVNDPVAARGNRQ